MAAGRGRSARWWVAPVLGEGRPRQQGIAMICCAALVLLCTLEVAGTAELQHPTDNSIRRREACMECPVSSFANQVIGSPCTKFGSCSPGECPVPPPDYNGPGFITPNGTKTLCTRCANGLYQDKPGSSTCMFCPNGKAPNEARDGCEECHDGEVSGMNITKGLCRSCFQIHYGFKSSADHTKCLPCSAGFMSLDGCSCTLCQRGFYWNPKVQACPSACPVGFKCTAKQVANASETYCGSCLPCPAGSFQSASAQYLCHPCSAGSYQPLQAQANCLVCERGKYQPEQGGIECFQCPAGSFCPNRTSKVPCPEGHYCPAGSTQPSTCPSLFNSSPTSCSWSNQLIIIVASCAVGVVAVLTVLVYRRQRLQRRKQDEARALLVAQTRNKRPRYTGL